MKFMAEATQRSTRIEQFQATEANIPVNAAPAVFAQQASTVMPEGFTRGNISEQANNVYTIVFAQPFARAPTFSVTARESGTGVSYICNIASTAIDRISWRAENDASAGGAPTGFHVIVVGSDSADVI